MCESGERPLDTGHVVPNPGNFDLAITLGLTLSMVYKLPLRQRQGLMHSISKLKARRFEDQQTEARIGATILNKMTELVRPRCRRVKHAKKLMNGGERPQDLDDPRAGYAEGRGKYCVR